MADRGSGWDGIDVRKLVEAAIRRGLREVAGGARGLRGDYRLVVRLTLTAAGGGELAHLLRDERDPSLVAAPAIADAWWRPVRFVEGNRVSVVSMVRRLRRAARAFPPIERALRSNDPLRVRLSAEEVSTFLLDAATKLARQGVVIQLPAELTPDGRARLRARLHIGSTDETSRLPSWGMADAATEPFRWELAIGDVEITADEFTALAAAKRSIVQVRGRWIAVDPGELAEAAKALGELRAGVMPAAQATGLALAGEVPVTKAVTATIVPAERVARTVELARDLEVSRDVAEPATFNGQLRPYQRRGLAWLLHLERAKVGGVLADDMGLGKTAQVVALVLAQVDSGHDRGATLVISPASVLPNWERELRTFAPSLRVVRHHGQTRARRVETLARDNKPGVVVLTTYATLRSSQKLLAGLTWERVVLDEAQNIKTPTASQSRAARSLLARHRVALTGTPVENRLDDLWSILEFTNPGLLGPRATFRRRFAGPVERGDTGAAERLRSLVRPFLLRRTKTDPAIAIDLPDKVDADVSCSLTVEQGTLYQAAVDQALADLETMTGMRRRARILTLLTEIKQVCDHPALYLHERGPLAERSGKLDRLTEMLEETIEEGDATLVFTQFAEMGHLLVRHLEERFDIDVPFLHGDVPLADRAELVEVFQHPAGPPVMVASLRAGGVGLNITRATHVVHYDRWWNPAVEDQATDRAHRIGQHRTVFVHRLQVEGTIEERISELIDRKRSIAGQVVQTGEGWLTELTTDDLAALVSLRSAPRG